MLKMPNTVKDLSAITKCYDLTLWMTEKLNKFPRTHKFTLGDRIENGLLAVVLLTKRRCGA